MSLYSKNRILFTTSAFEGSRQALTAKVRGFARLPVGFSHGEGIPVTHEAIDSADELILLASDLGLEADVFPNLDGGCAVAFYKGDAKVEVSISSDGTKLDLRGEHGVGFAFEDVISECQNVGFLEVIRQVTLLKMLGCDIWKLYASSISANLTGAPNASGISCTETLPRRRAPRLLLTEKGGSQSSTSLVPALVPA